ncbi:MAG TPA: glycoside hydrolase family 47 protein, partial [Oleiagrimonas sp.]|nr:glycoside hydrolase family 47 protein [Oleiagrimonas sp.]
PHAAGSALAPVPEVSDAEAAKLAEQVRQAVDHAWDGYMAHAKGFDELKPISGGSRNWYAQSLLMTPVDSLDTLLMLGLDKDASQAHQLIVDQLSFDKDIWVKNFEITIRELGGLLSAYQMTGDDRLLKLAEDLGQRLLPAFDSPTGMPYVMVNLKTGEVRGKISNPAETGTLLLEFGTLSKLTGNPVYYNKAKKALVATWERRSDLGLVGQSINVETGEWTNTDSSVAGGIDSYYEYLYKCWRLFNDKDCKHMWQTSIQGVNTYVADEVRDDELWYGHVDMNTGKRTSTTYGALDAFMPGLLAYSGFMERAKRLQESGFKMWQLHGIEPEGINYATMKVTAPGYPLRPEIIESAWYLYHLTGDNRYRGMGKVMFDDFVKYTRTPYGFAALKDVRTKQKVDSMESFVMAETFKYFYLLFAPQSKVDLSAMVLNTEAHPLRKTW